MQQRVFGRVREVMPVPNLRDLQIESYRAFLSHPGKHHHKVISVLFFPHGPELRNHEAGRSRGHDFSGQVDGVVVGRLDAC